MRQSDEIDKISTALHAAKAEIRDVTRDTEAHKYKYADLEQILKSIRPILDKHKLELTQGAGISGNYLVVTTTVRLVGTNQWVHEEMPLPVENKSSMNGFQHFGSGMTYGRRYALAAFFNITQKDDDGDTSPRLNATTLDAIFVIRNAFENDDKLLALDYFNPLRADIKREIYANISQDMAKWMNTVLNIRR